MYVTKRDGTKEVIDISKIRKQTLDATKDLDNVSLSELETGAQIHFIDGIKTEDIQKTLIKTAADLIDVDAPNWTFVASRLFIYDLRHRVNGYNGYSHLRDYIEHAVNENKMLRGYYEVFDLEYLNSQIVPERDELFTYLGIKTLYDRYLLKDSTGHPIELPQHMFMAVAMYLAHKEEHPDYYAIQFYNALSKFEMMCATPTLSNARTTRPQMSSCFVNSIPDNIEGIFDVYKEMALLSKFGAGVGTDVSKIRAIGSEIDKHVKASGGVVPFMKITNDIAVAVDQLGCIASDSYVIIANSDGTNERKVLIGDVQVHDYILSFNIATGQNEFREVLEVHDVVVKRKDQIRIEFEDGNYIITSSWHPLCVYEDNRYTYKPSKDLRVGDIAVGTRGNTLIKAINIDPNVDVNYKDLTVDYNNNYFASTHNQDGEYYVTHNTRKGAIAVYLEVWHQDVKDFIDLRKNSGEERRRAHDLFPALWIPDLFMKRVLDNSTWTLLDPYEVSDLTDLYGEEFEQKYIEYENNPDIRKEVVNAKDLWKTILTNYFESGLPFLCFKDNANRTNPNTGIIRSSNLCTEIFQNTEPAHYVVHVEYTDGSTNEFEENDIITTSNNIIKPARKITDIDIIDGKQVYHVSKVGKGGRTAVCNLASINLLKVNTKEDLERIVPIAIRMLDNVIDLNLYPSRKAKVCNMENRAIGLGVMGEAAMLATNQIEWGSDVHLTKIDEIMEIISYNAIKASADLAKEKGVYPEYRLSKWSQGIFPIDLANQHAKDLITRDRVYNWDDLRSYVKENGMRNGYLMAIAPTSSISILTGTTQTIEPVYKRKWFEENLSGMVTNIVPNLNLDTWNYYVSAYDIDQLLIIKAAAIRQKWVDQGQSVNIFMDLEKASGKYLHEIYTLAWRLGLKSTYYLRSMSPDAEAKNAVDRSVECQSCQ